MNERRIATVLRVRELQERIARSEVARRRLALAALRDAEAAAWQSVRDHAATAPASPHRFVGHRAMLHAGVVDAHRAAGQVALATDQVEHAMEAWQAEARRLDGIERLAERLRSEAVAEDARRTANEIDDLVVMRHPNEEGR